jgi:hemolysin activation/secretion protein
MFGLPLSKLRYFCAFIFAMSGAHAYAQTVPSSADPGRIGLPANPASKVFDLTPSNPQSLSQSSLTPEQAAKTLTLKTITLRGAKAFTQQELQSLYAHAINTRITVGELYVLVDVIRRHYMDDGYTLSKVTLNPRGIEQGEIMLDVVEGYVSEVTLDPSLSDTPILRSFVHEVTAMRPLNTKQLERLMLVLNMRPGLQVSSVLSAPNERDVASGAVILTLQPKSQQPDRSFVAFDNHGSRFVGPTQVSIGTVISHMAYNYDDLFLSGGITEQMKELKQAAVEYTVPFLGVSGALMQLSANVNRTEPGGRLADLEVQGKSHQLNMQLSYPLVLQRDENWLVSAGFHYKNTQTDILGAPLFDDRLRVVSLSSRYSVSDHWGGVNRLQLEASKGLNILGARPSGSADLSRADGRSDFVKTEFNASRLQTVTRAIDVLASARGQHTNDPLLSSEEFGVGGAGIGRGYDPSEITGDRGLSASLELRYSHDFPAIDTTLQPYGFYDVGKVWNIDPSDKNHGSIVSAGGGVRLYSDHGWNADILAAIPLAKPADEPQGHANGNSPRFLMSIRKTF